MPCPDLSWLQPGNAAVGNPAFSVFQQNASSPTAPAASELQMSNFTYATSVTFLFDQIIVNGAQCCYGIV